MTTAPSATPAAPAANPFANFSNLALADAMGDVSVALKAAQSRQDDLREEMTRRHLSSLEGARFTVTKDVKDESRFDSAAVKKAMGKAWYESFQRPNTRTTYTVRERAPEQLGVAA